MPKLITKSTTAPKSTPLAARRRFSPKAIGITSSLFVVAFAVHIITAGAATTSGRQIAVKNSAQLTAALAGAKAGDTITMADGTYTGSFVSGSYKAAFGVKVPGAATAPITLTGSRKAIIDGQSTASRYGLYLSGANYWHINGITVRNASKGIVTDQTKFATISNVLVTDTGQEGIHLRTFSTDNIVSGNTVTRTGLVTPEYGEGIYIGSAKSNWATYTAGQPDTSDRNQVSSNTISRTAAESIDIKEGTSRGIISRNNFDGTGMTGANAADSWMDVKGNNYTISDNTAANSINDGYQVHSVLAGWGLNNTFRYNIATVNGPGYGFFIATSATGNTVSCTNTVTVAGKGFANVPCKN